LRTGASQRGVRPDHAHGEALFAPALAQARVEDRRLPARVGADQEAGVGVLDSGDGGVEQIAGAPRRVDPGPVLAAIEMGRAQRPHQILERHHRLGIDQVPGERRDPVARQPLEPGGDRVEGLIPACRFKAVATANIGRVQALAREPVAGEARFIGDPFLVHVFIEAGQDAHDLLAEGVDADVAADGVEDVDRIGRAQFPGPCLEGVRLRCQRPDRA